MSPERPPIAPDGDARRLRRAFLFAVAGAALLWAIKLAELGFGLDILPYGLYPGRLSALPNILSAPLLHGSLSHLFANTAPVVVLGTALIYGYPRATRFVLPVVYLGSGLGVWLFARPAWHIGASGLTFGMMFFVFTVGVLRWDRRAIALSMAVFLLYGGMIWSIFPSDPGISFEYHLCGAVLGVALAAMLRRRDPPPPEKVYSWEGKDEDGDDWPYEDMPGGDDETPRIFEPHGPEPSVADPGDTARGR